LGISNWGEKKVKRKEKNRKISAFASVDLTPYHEASFPALHNTPAIQHPEGCKSTNMHHILAADRSVGRRHPLVLHRVVRVLGNLWLVSPRVDRDVGVYRV
jgi:hypothetical protein